MYHFDRWDEGVAQRVRAEREDGITRLLEAIYWWPAREGPEWPATIVTIPEGADAWAHFEAALGMDERYRWEPLPSE